MNQLPQNSDSSAPIFNKDDRMNDARISIRVPLELKIKMDVEREKYKLSMNAWIIGILEESLSKSTSSMSEDVELLKKELAEMKKLLLPK